jgi:hypothetical protein
MRLLSPGRAAALPPRCAPRRCHSTDVSELLPPPVSGKAPPTPAVIWPTVPCTTSRGVSQIRFCATTAHLLRAATPQCAFGPSMPRHTGSVKPRQRASPPQPSRIPRHRLQGNCKVFATGAGYPVCARWTRSGGSLPWSRLYHRRISAQGREAQTTAHPSPLLTAQIALGVRRAARTTPLDMGTRIVASLARAQECATAQE